MTPPSYARPGIPRPYTSIAESSLFTGSPSDPQLVHELQAEMKSADAVDILVPCIKWSGLLKNKIRSQFVNETDFVNITDIQGQPISLTKRT